MHNCLFSILNDLNFVDIKVHRRKICSFISEILKIISDDLFSSNVNNKLIDTKKFFQGVVQQNKPKN